MRLSVCAQLCGSALPVFVLAEAVPVVSAQKNRGKESQPAHWSRSSHLSFNLIIISIIIIVIF